MSQSVVVSVVIRGRFPDMLMHPDALDS
jgi:hypothetical protein